MSRVGRETKQLAWRGSTRTRRLAHSCRWKESWREEVDVKRKYTSGCEVLSPEEKIGVVWRVRGGHVCSTVAKSAGARSVCEAWRKTSRVKSEEHKGRDAPWRLKKNWLRDRAGNRKVRASSVIARRRNVVFWPRGNEVNVKRMMSYVLALQQPVCIWILALLHFIST